MLAALLSLACSFAQTTKKTTAKKKGKPPYVIINPRMIKFDNSSPSIGLFGSFGGQFKNGANMGFGFGLFQHEGYSGAHVPAYLELGLSPTKKKANPYVSGKIGIDIYSDQKAYYSTITQTNGGLFTEISAGILFRTKSRQGIFVHGSFTSFNTTSEIRGTNGYKTNINTTINGFSIGFGVKL